MCQEPIEQQRSWDTLFSHSVAEFPFGEAMVYRLKHTIYEFQSEKGEFGMGVWEGPLLHGYTATKFTLILGKV